MRLASTFVLLSSLAAFLLPPVTAIHPHVLAHRDSKSSSPAPALAIRQHRQPRALIDICISIDGDIFADAAGLLGVDPLNIFTHIHLCLCLKDLDIFLDTDVEAKLLVGLLGRDTVAAIIKAIINTSPDAQQCTLPPHAHRTCNNRDPCHYECDPHYIRNGNTCNCAPPYIECNGVCGTFPRGCGSAVPRTLRAREGPITTLAQAQTTCKVNESVCGIPGREDSPDFECVDLSNTLDSCGGCMVPHPFPESDPVKRPSGTECARLPNVIEVGCSDYHCLVHRCKEGWKPSPDRSECISKSAGSSVGALRMKKEKRRDTTPSPDGSASDLVLDSDLKSQLSSVTKLVITLNSDSDLLYTTSTSANADLVTNLLQLTGAIVQAAVDLLGSPTISSLVGNVYALVDASALFYNTLNGCGCVDSLGLGPLMTDLDALVAASLDLKYWCRTHPVAHPASGTTHNAPSPPNTSERPIVVGLSKLLAELGLGGVKSAVVVGGLGNEINDPINNILEGLELGPGEARKRHDSPALVDSGTVVDSDFLVKLYALVDVVADLNSHSALLPPTPATSSASASSPSSAAQPAVDSNLVSSIVQATVDLLSSPTINSLLDNTQALININGLVATTLKNCGCVDDLGLGPLLVDLEAVTVASLDLGNWCHNNSVVPSTSGTVSSGSSSGIHGGSTSYGSERPIIVGLSDLYHRLGFPGGKGVLVLGGLGNGINNPTNDLLEGLDIGPGQVKRSRGISNGAEETPIVTGLSDLYHKLGFTGSKGALEFGGLGDGINKPTNNLLETLGAGPGEVKRDQDSYSNLMNQMNVLVAVVADLNGHCSLLPNASSNSPPRLSPSSSASPVDSDLVVSIVQATGAVLSSSTYSSLLANIDALLDVNTLVGNSLHGCGCVDELGLGPLMTDLDAIAAASLNLKGLCGGLLGSSLSSASHAGPSHGTHGRPIIIDASSLLTELGLPGLETDAVVGGLGDELDDPVNSALEGLNLGG